MTPTSPTWGDVEQFLAADGWRQLPGAARGGKRQTHIFFEKQIPDGRTLQAHISHDRSNTMSPGRFGSVLRWELEVSKEEFWDAIRSGQAVDRPVPVDEEEVVEHPAWVTAVLLGPLHMDAEEIAGLSEAQAVELVQQHWSRERH
jgi:hypothetical protein